MHVGGHSEGWNDGELRDWTGGGGYPVSDYTFNIVVAHNIKVLIHVQIVVEDYAKAKLRRPDLKPFPPDGSWTKNFYDK